MSYDKIESNIRALVLFNLLTSLRKRDKCSASLAFYLFPQTRLINSIEDEHSCKILYLKWEGVQKLWLNYADWRSLSRLKVMGFSPLISCPLHIFFTPGRIFIDLW